MGVYRETSSDLLPLYEEFLSGGERNEEMIDGKIDLDKEEKDRDTG